MNWVFFAAFIVASSAAKLDRTYLPPASAASAGGSPGSLQTPLAKSEEQSLPVGSFVNEHDGVVVDVAPVGTRASQSGLGGPRISYGSTDSKVGEAAFRENHQTPPKFGSNIPSNLDSNPDLSAFHQPAKPSRTSFQISRDNGAHTIKYHNDLESDRYSYGFEADNGIKAEEKGVISNGVQAEGEFSYVGDDGKVYSVAYTADKNGYRPVGSHLPTPPPIPAEILRALEQNSKDEAAGLSEDGSYDPQKYNTGDYTKSDANGKYNDGQTIKFSIRPGSSSDTSTTFINENQGGFTKPSVIESIKNTKDNIKIESSNNTPQINGFGINFINRNNYNQGQINLNAEIGSRKEFVQQKLQGSISSNLGSSLINKDSRNTINSPKPLSQQDLQESINSGQDNSRPSSYDTSFSTVVSDDVPSKLNTQSSQGYVTSSLLEEKKNQPTEAAFTQNFYIRNAESKLQATTMNINKPVVSKLGDENYSQNSFTTQAFHNQMTQNLNNRFSTSQSNTGTFTSFGFDQTKATNDRISGASSFSSATKPVLPTKQPERVLTTPFDSFTTTTNNAQLPTTFGINQDQYTGPNFANLPGLTPTSKFSSIPFTQQEINIKTTPQTQFTSMNYNDLKVTNSPFSTSSPSQNVHLLNQQRKPTENKLQTTSQFSSIRPHSNKLSQSTPDPNLIKSTQFNGQTHGPHASYFYNKPSDSIHSDQQLPTTFSDPFGSTIINKQHTKLTEGNKNFISSTNSQNISEFNRQTNSPTLAPFSQETVLENQGSYQTKGITQASISPFPSIFSTSLNSKDSGKINYKPFQQTTQINSQSQTQFFEPNKVTATGIVQSSFTDQSNFNRNSNSQTQQYDNKIYEYNKPLQSFPAASPANKHQGHLGTKFSMTTPFHVNKSVTSNQNEETSFERQISSKFGKQDTNLDEKTSPFELQPSTQPFNDKLTTSSIQNPTDVTENRKQNQGSENTSQFEIYEYIKPLQSLTSASPKEQINRNENQKTPLREFNKQSTIAYTGRYTETTDDFQKESQLTTQFNQEEFERKTEVPEFSQTASTFDPSIYQYTKPVQSTLTTFKQEYDIPQRETPVGVMSTNFVKNYSGAQQFGIQSSHDRGNSKQTTLSQFTQANQPSITQLINTLSIPFPGMSQQQLNNRLNSENQENIGEIYNYQKPIQNYSSSEQMTKPIHKGQNSHFNSQFQNQKIQNQESGTASLPGTMTTLTYQTQPSSMSIASATVAQHSFNSKEQPQKNSQLSEIYEYSKPPKTLTTSAQNNILGQNINQQLRERLNEVNSKPNTFIQNLSGDSSTTQNEPTSTPLMATQINFNTQDKFTKPDGTTVTQTSVTSGINSKPIGTRPQFAFQSACCRGLPAQKHQEPQFTQSTVQNNSNTDLKSNQHFESQKLTTQGIITGEDFGGPRKPPSFDDKGYHY